MNELLVGMMFTTGLVFFTGGHHLMLEHAPANRVHVATSIVGGLLLMTLAFVIVSSAATIGDDG